MYKCYELTVETFSPSGKLDLVWSGWAGDD